MREALRILLAKRPHMRTARAFGVIHRGVRVTQQLGGTPCRHGVARHADARAHRGPYARSVNGSRMRTITSCATRVASPGGASTRKITNSSPPMRDTWTRSPSNSERRWPMTRSTSSPAAWPIESLISLNRSRSMKSRSTESAAPSSTRSFRRISSSRRLMRPVSSSCVAWRNKRSEIARASVTSPRS